MEHQPEWVCVCACACERASCAIMPRSQWEIIGLPFVLIKEPLKHSSPSPYVVVFLHPVPFSLRALLHVYAPAATHTPLTTTLSGWIFLFHVASCLSAPNYHFLRSCRSPPPCFLLALLNERWSPSQPVRCTPVTQWPECLFFFPLLILGEGGQKKNWQGKVTSALRDSCRETAQGARGYYSSLYLTVVVEAHQNLCLLPTHTVSKTRPPSPPHQSVHRQPSRRGQLLSDTHTHTKSPTSAWGSPQPPAQTSLSSRAVTQPHSVTKSHTVLKGVSCLITGYVFLFFFFLQSPRGSRAKNALDVSRVCRVHEFRLPSLS